MPALDPQPAPGTTAKVVFAADAQGQGNTAAAGVRIPAASVVQRGELSGVYVVQGNRLLLRQLRLGAHHGETVEVISGLRAGEVIARDPLAATQAIAEQRKAMEAARD